MKKKNNRTDLEQNGSLQIQMGYDSMRRIVLMRFGTPISEAYFTPEQAKSLGESLIEQGKLANGKAS